jgi:O-antigen ligase
MFQGEASQRFVLHFLDRGCAVLSLLSWSVMFYIFRHKKVLWWIFGGGYISAVAYLLMCSDSLASYVGFVCGVICFVLTLLMRSFFVRIIPVFVIAMCIAMPIFSYFQDPRLLSDTYPSSPDSGKHRLFIWKYVATNAMQKPLSGWGFDSSRSFSIDEENDIVYYNQYAFNPLPLHPHNNILQMLLECGIVGLILLSGIWVKITSGIYKMGKGENYGLLWMAVCSGCFMNYFVIAMLSYGMWQLWWVAIAFFVLLLMSSIGRVDESSKSKIA